MSAYVESVVSGGAAVQRTTWMRRIKLVFTAKGAFDKKQTDLAEEIFGTAPDDKKTGLSVTVDSSAGDNLAIHIEGTKFLALSKDCGTIRINNVAYETIATIMSLKLYRVEIWAGYVDNNFMRIATGEVSYISQKIHSRHDTELYITYASELVAAWSQNRINFSMRSGVNAYAMLEYLFRDGNGSAAKLDTKLKNVVYDEMYQDVGISKSIVEQVVNNAQAGYFLSSDSSLDGKVINVTSLGEKRVIPINSNMINIGNGNPTVTSQGLDITLFPVLNLVPGDILQIDSSLIDFSSGTQNPENVTKTFNTNYMDPNGCYMIRQLQYVLENRGNAFYYRIQAISPKVYEGVTGALS